MRSDWAFTLDNTYCGLRSVGVLVKNGKILIQRDRDGNEYALPGGHIKVGETLEEGLIREFKEETGADIKSERLIWVEESFWGKTHGICFYFLIELCDGSDIPECREFVSQKDNCNVVLGWMPIDKLNELIIYPEFLEQEINDLTSPTKHFVCRY